MLKKNQVNIDMLSAALESNGYEVSVSVQQQLIKYLQLLHQWNRVFNLTAIRNLEDMLWLHIIDSLSISPYLHGLRIIDVGTGAGLPGIPLALTHPDKQFVLLDSNSKKTRFLTQVIHELKIENIEVVHERIEKYQPALPFDSIISRAFSSITTMLDQTHHLAATGAQFLAMKGLYPEQEIQALSEDFILVKAHQLIIKGLAAERHLICIKRKE